MATCADVPAWLDDLLKRMLAKEPDHRPSSMIEVSKALCEYKALGRTRATRAVAPAKPVGRRGPARGPAAPMLGRLRARRAEVTIALAAVVVVASAVWAIRRNTVLARGSRNMAETVVTGELRASAPPAVPGLVDTALKANAAMLPVNVEPRPVPISAVGVGASTAPAVRKRAPPANRGRSRPTTPEPRRLVDADGIVDL
jgi:hypothetical protein